jgi:cytidylate kinase
VTISASYGAGGSIVGPAVAERLGFEFYDRAVPVAVAHELACETARAEAADERPPGRLDRFIGALAGLAVPIGPDVPTQFVDPRNEFTRATEEVLRRIADGPGGVVLGRAGMVVLADRPDVLRVRLDGPVEARIAQAVRLQGIDEKAAAAEQRESDRAREGYAQAFYGVSQADPALYQLIIDSTSLGLELCADLVVLAARGLLAQASPDRVAALTALGRTSQPARSAPLPGPDSPSTPSG